MADEEIAPPWVKYPKWECGDIAWRMGVGEDHARLWAPMWRAMSRDEQLAYLDKHNAPADWREDLMSDDEDEDD